MQRTDIEWTHMLGHTGMSWNPVTGCLHGCPWCYARGIARRFTNAFPHGFEPDFHPTRLDQPIQRKKPAFIFTVSMGDLFGAWVPKEWMDAVLTTIIRSPQHTFAVLTKDPGRMAWFSHQRPFPPNLWVGTSACDQVQVDERVPALLRVDAALRFLSLEPIQGPVDPISLLGLDWLIIGCQTGPHAPIPDQAMVRHQARLAELDELPCFVKANTGRPGPRQWPDRRG